ncbi:hypothetical protein T05_14744 [Trichinella murrelli]|uniref:Uncharacterized protein n=1 Tax=Trichinella murrelli TaxID=144512 RepID=A0A0V0T585_9BILA|nr:hypothetical protein T05_16347 [Trichinella murrelli]KRX49932.1 hypothetical protein T05_14744 [Trichinella murrelli]
MASSIWYCSIAALRLSGTSAARKYLSMRRNHRTTSEDRVSASGGIIQRGFSDILPRSPIVAPSGARFICDTYDTVSLL